MEAGELIQRRDSNAICPTAKRTRSKMTSPNFEPTEIILPGGFGDGDSSLIDVPTIVSMALLLGCLSYCFVYGIRFGISQTTCLESYDNECNCKKK